VEIQTKGRLGTAPAVARRSATLWEFGFRPFYLLASLFACASLLLWIAQYSGLLPQPYLAGPLWHGHEMLFGFATAVIAGFLLTAVATWTQQPPTRGMLLAGLVLIWLAARVLVLTPWPLAAAAANLLFPLAVAAVIAVPLVRTRNRRNMLFIGLLALLAVLAALLHLAAIGAVALPAAVGLQAGLDVVLLVIVIIAGRVVPMFTNNGVPGAGATRNPMLEWAAPASVIVLLGADLLQVDGLLLAAIAWVGAGVQAARLALWRPWRTWRTPLVWILHAGYAWIALHLALRGIAAIGWLMPSVAVHALTVGAIGGMTIGMMTRTARGHTGRPLKAGVAETAMFVMVQAAALVRVGGAALLPGQFLAGVQLSGLLWSAAFGLYALIYWPVLTRPRIDGRPG
jgi:uncharacterized protein involved in response to NO